MTLRYPALLALLSGAVAAFGFAPLELWPLSIAGVAALLWLVQAAPSLRAALWRGWAFGVGHFTINNNWIQHAFDFQDAMPPVLGYGAVVALALYLAVYPMLAAGLAWRLARREGAPDAAYALAFTAAWIVTEWLRSQVFTGYAWNPLGTIWLPAGGVAGAARFVGTYALSGLVVLAAGGLLLIRDRRARLTEAVVALLLVLALFGGAQAPIAPANGPRVRIVQPGIGQDQRGEDDAEPMLQALLRNSGVPGAQPRLVLWPEGVVRDLVEDGYPWRYYYWQQSPARLRARLASVLGPRDVLLFGANALQFGPRETLETATNSIFAIDRSQTLTGRYDKAHLVPYGEYLPMPWLLKPLGLARLVPGGIDFRAGPGPRAMRIAPFGQVGMQICYEIIFSGEVVDAAHRPNLLFNPSTDAWFGKWGPPQHLAQARMRAIEEGLPILRATPTGISAAIGADGRVLARVPAGRAAAVELALPPALPPTLFGRVGNAMAFLVAGSLAALAIALRRRAR